MNLQNNKQSGFTIVELLIVVVVIGILAAITLVAFNGVQNRSKTTAGEALAGQVAKKAEAYNAIDNVYPSAKADFAKKPESKLDNEESVVETDLNSGSARGGKTVMYKPCTAGAGRSVTGAVISYWSYTDNAIKQNKIGVGCA